MTVFTSYLIIDKFVYPFWKNLAKIDPLHFAQKSRLPAIQQISSTRYWNESREASLLVDWTNCKFRRWMRRRRPAPNLNYKFTDLIATGLKTKTKFKNSANDTAIRKILDDIYIYK